MVTMPILLRYDIDGTDPGDCVASFCFPACVNCQTAAEVRHQMNIWHTVQHPDEHLNISRWTDDERLYSVHTRTCIIPIFPNPSDNQKYFCMYAVPHENFYVIVYKFTVSELKYIIFISTLLIIAELWGEIAFCVKNVLVCNVLSNFQLFSKQP